MVNSKFIHVATHCIIIETSPSLANVFRLYSSLVAGLTVADLCVHNDLDSMAINQRYNFFNL